MGVSGFFPILTKNPRGVHDCIYRLTAASCRGYDEHRAAIGLERMMSAAQHSGITGKLNKL
jgi:hypothetical protein